MELVRPQQKDFSSYLKYMDDKDMTRLKHMVNNLKDKKIAMINATSYGGGVAEKLHSLIPLLKGLGLQVDWWKISGEEEFFNITKEFHNRLQGQPGELQESDKNIYIRNNMENASRMKGWDYDIIVVHDPQPAALVAYAPPRSGKRWIWRCHIDTSNPNPAYWNFLYQYISCYDATVFTMKEFLVKNAGLSNVFYMNPTIDPLSDKNIELERERAEAVVSRFGIDPHKPVIAQVSRFDPWKDPLGVIDVYRNIKDEVPGLQLVLAGSMAADDPEGWDYLFRALRKAGEDYNIKVLTNFNGITALEVNAIQRVADVVIQKSLKEGFGLTVAEGMWKDTPVVGGNVGGIKLQIEDGVTGYLAESVEECAEKVLYILKNPEHAKKICAAGKVKVKKQFLITSNVLEYLRIFNMVSGEGLVSFK